MPGQRATRSQPHMAYDNTLHPQQDNLGCGRTQSFPHAPSIRRGGQDEKEEQKEWASRTLGKNGNKGWPAFPLLLGGSVRRLGVPLSQIVLLRVTTVTSASSFPSLESLERIGFVNTFQALERTRHRLRSGLGSGRAIATAILSANRVQR